MYRLKYNPLKSLKNKDFRVVLKFQRGSGAFSIYIYNLNAGIYCNSNEEMGIIMKKKIEYENPSIDEAVAWLGMNEEEKEKVDYDRLFNVISQYVENVFKDPQTYDVDLANSIRNHDYAKIRLLLNLPEICRLIYPQDFLILDENLYKIFNSRTNIANVVRIIYNNQWEKPNKWNPNNIFKDDFKEICVTPIWLFYSMYPVSGEYLLHILHPHGIKFYHSRKLDSSQYVRFYRLYMNDFMKYLSISMEGLFMPKGEDYTTENWIKKLQCDEEDMLSNEYCKNRSGTKGESFLNECDYVSYEMYNTKRKYNFLSIFEDSKTHEKLPYAEPFLNSCMHGNLEIHPKHRGRFLFKTLMIQNMSSASRVRLECLHMRCRLAICSIFSFMEQVQQYVECLITAKRTASTIESIKKYDKLLSDYKCYVEERLNYWIEDFEKHKTRYDCNKIYVTEENLYETVLWKLYTQEDEAIITGIKHAYRIPFQTHERVDAILDYLRLHPDECIEVRTWTDFKEKYSPYLRDFFPELSEESLQELWFQTINLLLCLFPDRYSITVEQHILPRPQTPMTQKWLDDREIDVGCIKARELFSFMHLMFFSSSCPVATKGSNTDFYYAPREEVGFQKHENKSLHIVLKNIKTHFTSKSAPHYNDVVIFQALIWEREQHYGFFLTKDWSKIFRKLMFLHLEVYERYIIHAENIKKCSYFARMFCEGRHKAIKNFLSDQKVLSREDPYLRKIFEIAGMTVAKIGKRDAEIVKGNSD